LIENPQRNNNKKEKKNEKEIKYMLGVVADPVALAKYRL
jgi:hypothetical protein